MISPPTISHDETTPGVATVVAHTFATTASLHALTTLSPAAIYVSVAVSAATLSPNHVPGSATAPKSS